MPTEEPQSPNRRDSALPATRWTAGRVPPVTDISDATVEEHLVHEHELHPERRYIWNEWGSFGSERVLEGKPYYQHLPADPLADVALSDSDAALFLEGYLMQFNTMPWLGTAKWCMFDTGEVNAALTNKICDGPFPDRTVTFRWPFCDYLGVCDMWRLPKEGFHFLQSQWTDEPMVHLVGHWTWPGETTFPMRTECLPHSATRAVQPCAMICARRDLRCGSSYRRKRRAWLPTMKM